jgi:hypothetical protein
VELAAELKRLFGVARDALNERERA